MSSAIYAKLNSE